MRAEIKFSDQPRRIRFPVIMEQEGTGALVLFTGVNTGIRLSFGDAGEEGETNLSYRPENDWLEATHPAWRPFKGSVVLSND